MTERVREIAAVAGRLSERQKRALCAFPDDMPVQMADGKTHYSRAWRKASEIGVSGNTLLSLNMVGGLNLKTLEPGPCLTTDDWSREGRHWSLTDLGLEVRRALLNDTQED